MADRYATSKLRKKRRAKPSKKRRAKYGKQRKGLSTMRLFTRRTAKPTKKRRKGMSSLRLLIGDRMSTVIWLGIASLLAAGAEAGILTIAAQAAASLVTGSSKIHIKLAGVTVHTTTGHLLLIGLGLAFFRLALQGAISYLPAVIGGDVQASMRRELFSAFTVASWNMQSRDREGQFQELMTNQITLASQGALQATLFVVSAFAFLTLAASAFALNVVAALAVLGAATVLFVILRPLSSIGARFARRLSAAQMEYAGAIGEANSVAEETTVFGIGRAQELRVSTFIATSRKYYVRSQTVARGVPGVYQSTIYIIIVGGLIAINSAHAGNFSSLGAVVLLLIRASTYGQQLQGAYAFVRQALPYIERLQEATDHYAASKPAVGHLPMDPVRALTFDKVSYAYRAGQPVLSDISYEVNGGETIGVVGPSGAGKSTMVQILLGLRFPDAGQYLINGVDTSEYSRDDWTRRVVYVPQQPRLVYASVADNVRFYRSIDHEAVVRACRLARIHDEIMSWPQQYDTIVGPRADAVSGGQQQRICLARALVAEPEVLVLDEPTSALDPRSEALIQESLVGLRQNLTMFIIAHRMSTLNICDRVMVILDGKLDAFDSLDTVRNTNQYYRSASSLASGTSEATATPDGAPSDELSSKRPVTGGFRRARGGGRYGTGP